MANPQSGGAQLVAQDGIKLPVQPAIRPAGNIGLSDRGYLTLLDATTVAFSAKLPDPAIVVGQPLCFKKTDSSGNPITLTPFAAETMDGASTLVLTQQYQTIQLVSDGTNWQVTESSSEGFDSINLQQQVQSAVTPAPILSIVGAANLANIASVESIDVKVNLSQTKQWATGSLTTQRAIQVSAPTYSFVGASTLTDAVLMELTGIPVAGTNATITTSTALRVVGSSADVASTRVGIGVTGTLSDGGVTSTTQARGIVVAQTINYSAASKTGAYCALYVNPTNTSLPAGVNGGAVFSSTASGLTGAVIMHNQTDEATNYEIFSLKYAANVATINSNKGGTGTARALALSVGATTGITLAATSAAVTVSTAATFSTSVTINATAAVGLAVTGAAASATATFTAPVQTTGTTVAVQIIGAINTGGACSLLSVTGAASTAQTASAEINFVNINLGQTVTWATGALVTQRCMRIVAPTLAFAGGSTVTTAATLSISGGPAAGANATITNNPFALFVESGDVCLAGSGSALATGAVTGFTWLPNMAGTPTGASVGPTGASSIVIDTSALKIWVRIAGTWRFASLT